jgi:2-(1,2-epoxy-1,2-dihydrophenyl)acetyl-CoA isomerase
MAYETLTLAIAEGVATITLNRPQVLNSLKAMLFQELGQVFDAVAADDAVRAVLMTGAGRAFCAGADLAAPPGTGGPKDPGDRTAESMHATINPLVAKIASLPKPVIAAVNGVTAGGGVGLALSADIVIAAKSATFIQVFGPQLGIVPDMGCTWYLPRLVGRARATGLALTGDRLPAETAAEWGLIWKAVDDADLMAEATALATRLASGPTTGFALIKKALKASETNGLEEQLHAEAEGQRIAFRTHDTKEGVRAFIEKRKPVFRGN